MILYNMRERGALEYDKFALNILQIANAINLEEMHEFKDLEATKNSLMTARKKATDGYNKITGHGNKQGISEQAYIKSLYIRGNKI